MFNYNNICRKLIRNFLNTHTRFFPLEEVTETKTETKPAAPIIFFKVSFLLYGAPLGLALTLLTNKILSGILKKTYPGTKF